MSLKACLQARLAGLEGSVSDKPGSSSYGFTGNRPKLPGSRPTTGYSLANTLQRGERAQNKCESGWEPEWLVHGNGEQVLANVCQGLLALCLARDVLDEEVDGPPDAQGIPSGLDHTQRHECVDHCIMAAQQKSLSSPQISIWCPNGCIDGPMKCG